jgi:hypothetical protein
MTALFMAARFPCLNWCMNQVNELGVVFVFGMLARKLGFVVLHLQPAFPDCEALRETIRGHWQRVRIEFEFESRNFLRHRHKKNGCDMIICWGDNWPDCPRILRSSNCTLYWAK